MRGLIVAGILLLGSAAAAQDGPYGGFAIGALDYTQPVTVALSSEDIASTYRLYGGFRFNDTWSIEGFYSISSTLDDSPLPSYTFRTDFDQIIELRGLAYFGNFLTGVGLWTADTTHLSFASFFSPGLAATSSDSGASFIVGGEWRKERWNIRLEYDLMDSDLYSDPSTLSLGAHFRFGGR